jgi:hypothetical protein
MGTRGAIGFIKNDVEKIAYNHSGSYPDWLGKHFLKYIESKTLEKLDNVFESITFIDEDEESAFDPDNGFANQFEDYKTFLYNSLFCEWAYIINLDTKKLEIYEGFNKNPNAKGRYANHYAYNDDHRYCGVALVKAIPLNKIFKGKIKVIGNKFVEEK